ncbi:protein of unknown function [Paraburkholderia kururiensis]
MGFGLQPSPLRAAHRPLGDTRHRFIQPPEERLTTISGDFL